MRSFTISALAATFLATFAAAAPAGGPQGPPGSTITVDLFNVAGLEAELNVPAGESGINVPNPNSQPIARVDILGPTPSPDGCFLIFQNGSTSPSYQYGGQNFVTPLTVVKTVVCPEPQT